MSDQFQRDIPPRAAAVVIALALLAGVVTGNEDRRFPASISPEASSVVTRQEEKPLDLAPLSRRAREGEIEDIFAIATPAAPASRAAPAPAPQPAAKPEPPRPPAAPPLPFKYLGHAVRGERVTVYLERNQDLLVAAAGDTLDGAYKVESVSDSAVQFVYLPLGARQALEIPSPYSGGRP